MRSTDQNISKPSASITIKPVHLNSYVAGKPIYSGEQLEVFFPYDKQLAGTVTMANRTLVDDAIKSALQGPKNLSRYERYQILDKARQLLESRQDEFARLITSESGLCIRDALYETGRARDVLFFAAMETLRDDGQIFSCDISPNGKARKIFTTREPLDLAVAITPFNHPLNQVVHKVAPALAAGTPVILKPSEKTPLTAIRLVELLYEAGLPGYMLSVLVGPTSEVAEQLVADPRVSLVSFTGSVAVGKRIAHTAGYKKVILELGGNDPLIVLEDADMELAVTLAAEGAFRNSGQRCTSVKRLLVQEGIIERFTELMVERGKTYRIGDPFDLETRIGTVIDESAAMYLEEVVQKAVSDGAEVRMGGRRQHAVMEPTILAHVPRTTPMVVQESFGPLAPIITISDINDAIEVANASSYGLSSGVVTNDMQKALKAIKELKTGTVNINEMPGYRLESSPFGGIKDSGLGIKEGVIEAMKCFSYVKTFSLPW
ncbi:phosphonoacetaldehyde dehydrogenase [Parapedobacter tibetensis]|uniref:phosphonoacetaldehyde dehydrogenase n=1 Tax=Parapedobacter tibetensis TaxID=2972951 RepID=UPI00214DF02A|nr:phosphonoacetaldehyde dehydrogenase [Parapedobacter tibetensis]